MKKRKKKYMPQPQNDQSLALLAAGLSDDFNNILTVILGACSLIDLDADLASELTRSVSLIRKSAEHAADLADRLALMSGMHSKK